MGSSVQLSALILLQPAESIQQKLKQQHAESAWDVIAAPPSNHLDTQTEA